MTYREAAGQTSAMRSRGRRSGLVNGLRLSVLAAASGLLPFVAWAAPATGHSCAPRDGETSRPSVGLALGGGGARGVAHISVLRKLEEMRIPVDCIVGTSMGSLVGGLYAAGTSVDDLERLVLEIDWGVMFDDSIARRDRSFRRKQDDRDSLTTIGVGIRNGKLSVTPGVMQGERILSLFEQKTLEVSEIDDFDRLPIPFRATGTDLNTGEVVELGSGSLAAAMRASMSLPGIFQPVEIDGKILIDGGIADQVPIDVVRRMGADIVIAVDVGTPLTALGSHASLLQVVSQLSGMLTVGNARASVARLSERDVLIVPELGEEVTTGSFGKAAEALRIGRAAADEAEPKLAAMPRYRGAPPAIPAGRVPVAEFARIENNSRYSDAVIQSAIDIPIGQPVDAQAIERSVLNLYGMGTFASVDYEIASEDGRTGVVIHAREKPQGPNYVQVGFRMETNFDGNYEFGLRTALLRAPVTPNGAEARLILALGSEPALQGEYFHLFDPAGTYYLQGRAGVSSISMPVFDDSGNRTATYDALTYGGRLALGRTLGRYGAIEAGVERISGDAEVQVGDPALPDVDTGSGTWFTTAIIDRIDSLYFPRHGYVARLSYESTAGWLGGDSEFKHAGIEVLGARSFGMHSLQLGASYRSTLSGELPMIKRDRMGGRGNLVGFHYNELTGQQAAVAMLGYSYRLASLFGRAAVVGGTLEYGNAWEARNQMRWSDGVLNGSAYLGFDSWIGPMLFGYGMREGGDGLFFLEIGKPY